MKCTELMVRFEKHDLKLVELDGERYMTSRALALALDTKVRSMKKLVQEMKARGELKEGVHLKCTPVRTYGRAQATTLITYRGLIRVAMRSDSAKAVQFRDWAEDVLYGVMTRTGGDAQALRSVIEKGLKEIGTANDQATKKACELILSLRSGEPTVLGTARRPLVKMHGHLTAIQWVKKYYPGYIFPAMNGGGRFERYVARRFLAERLRWPEHDETKRLYAWVYLESRDREFLESCLIGFLEKELPRAIRLGNGGGQKAITAGGV